MRCSDASVWHKTVSITTGSLSDLLRLGRQHISSLSARGRLGGGHGGLPLNGPLDDEQQHFTRDANAIQQRTATLMELLVARS